MIDRRRFLGMLLMSTSAFGAGGRTIALPPPDTSTSATLMGALRARRSTREFASRPLPPAVLATLLWCAFGVNRPESGRRTAPSAHNWQEIDVYAVQADGAFRYDAPAHALREVTAADVRAATGMQDFVATAPLDLVYVADFTKMTDAGAEERTFLSAANAGCIAQNAYLFCAASGLACVVRGWIDRARLAPALELRAAQRIVLAQTVGYPR
jgi:SagB-type dehydrogenase family enzyme